MTRSCTKWEVQTHDAIMLELLHFLLGLCHHHVVYVNKAIPLDFYTRMYCVHQDPDCIEKTAWNLARRAMALDSQPDGD